MSTSSCLMSTSTEVLRRAYRAKRLAIRYTEVPGVYELTGSTYRLRAYLNDIQALFDGETWLIDDEQRKLIEGT